MILVAVKMEEDKMAQKTTARRITYHPYKFRAIFLVCVEYFEKQQSKAVLQVRLFVQIYWWKSRAPSVWRSLEKRHVS